jgi:hypothetical protein
MGGLNARSVSPVPTEQRGGARRAGIILPTSSTAGCRFGAAACACAASVSLARTRVRPNPASYWGLSLSKLLFHDGPGRRSGLLLGYSASSSWCRGGCGPGGPGGVQWGRRWEHHSRWHVGFFFCSGRGMGDLATAPCVARTTSPCAGPVGSLFRPATPRVSHAKQSALRGTCWHHSPALA